MMSNLDWAKREIEIACKRENSDRKDGEFDYGCACYESALKAFKSLSEDHHSGYSIMETKNILNRLIDGKCLTPIEDTDDIWVYSFDRNDGTRFYQCNRMFSLHKVVHPDGSITYDDVNRVLSCDVSSPNIRYYTGFIANKINKMFPITMPYYPESKPYEVYCDKLLTDPKNEDHDSLAMLYCIKPDGERVEINRYFKWSEDGFVEISFDEWCEREQLANNLKEDNIDE